MTDRKLDFYAVLGVARTATQQEITDAYRKAAKTDHPDKFTDPVEKEAANLRQKERNAARDVLSDPGKRKEYDRTRDDAIQMAVDLAFEINRDGDPEKVQALNDLIEMHGLTDEELNKALDEREKEAGVAPAAEGDAQEEAPEEAASFDDVDDGRESVGSSFHRHAPPPKLYPDPRDLLQDPATRDVFHSDCARKFRAALRRGKIDGAWMKEFVGEAASWAQSRHGSLGLERLDEIAGHIDRTLVMHPALGDHIIDELRGLTEACLDQRLWNSYGEISSWSKDIKAPPWGKLLTSVSETPGLMRKVFSEDYLRDRMSFSDIQEGYGQAHAVKHIAIWMLDNGHLDRAWPARFREWSEEKSRGEKTARGYEHSMRTHLIEEIEYTVAYHDQKKNAAPSPPGFGA